MRYDSNRQSPRLRTCHLAYRLVNEPLSHLSSSAQHKGHEEKTFVARKDACCERAPLGRRVPARPCSQARPPRTWGAAEKSVGD